MNQRLIKAISKFRLFENGIREFLYWNWVLGSYYSHKVILDIHQKVTVIVPSYHVKRARNLEPLIRMTLKCNFVENIIISNHNPEVKLDEWIKLNDNRIVLINQPIRRGCGYCWIVASKEKGEYFIIIDDDTLIKPRQLAFLFQELIAHPEIPHGLAGAINNKYLMNKECEVKVLFHIYAVTKAQIELYLKYVSELTKNFMIEYENIEYFADDIVISLTGNDKARIHDAGYLLKCKTFESTDVAIHKENDFRHFRLEVINAMEKVKQKLS